MSFKATLEKYKTGTATAAEKRAVEEEIEKSEAISEYLSGQIMDSIPNAPIGVDLPEASKIRGQVNRKLRGAIALAALAFIAIACAALVIVFPIVNSTFYNPLKGAKNEIGGKNWGQMSIDMSVFSELHLKGFETPFVYAESFGFGKYDLTVYQYDTFRNYAETQYRSWIVRGKLDRSSLGDALSRGLGFYWIYGQYTDDEQLEEIGKVSAHELSRLPESAQVKAYLFFSAPLGLEELAAFVKESQARVLWTGIKCSSEESFWDGKFGFSPLGKRTPLAQSAYSQEQFPILELDESAPSGGVDIVDYSKLSASAYEIHFQSMLDYMASREEFLEVMGIRYDYKGALSYVRKNGMLCHGALVAGSRDEVDGLAKDPKIKHIVIDDVMASRYSRS
jgi:hypothetical protein